MSTDDAATRAARGAALLDSKLPGWAQRVQVGSLQIADCTECVLGQLGSYRVGVKKLSGMDIETAAACGWIIAHGFAVGTGSNRTLTACWRTEIAMRLAPSVQAQVNAAVAAPARRPARVA